MIYEKTIFVFGSNSEGKHGAGAAKEAYTNHGAVWGKQYGLQGNSYAIVTKRLGRGLRSVSLGSIQQQVNILLEFAAKNPTWKFIVTPIGCSLAGFKHYEIAPFFKAKPTNMELPILFRIHLKQKAA